MIVRLFGGILIAIGILVMTCSGLCSLIVLASVFRGAFQNPMIILPPLFIGGIPFALGFGIFRWGQVLLRRSNRDEN